MHGLLTICTSHSSHEFVDIITGPQHCLYDGLSIPHGDLFHPPSMYKAFEEEMLKKQARSNSTVSAKDISVNPFCTQCECKVSR